MQPFGAPGPVLARSRPHQVTSQIKGIIDGTITDFEDFDQRLALKERAKQIRQEEQLARRQKVLLEGSEGKGKCTRCQQSDQMMSQEARRAELMEKLDVFKEEKNKHKWRKASQATPLREEEGDPIVPRDNPEFLAMEADLKDRKRKQCDKAKTAEKCRQRGNQCMTEGDFVGAIEHYDEGLEYRRDLKALWTNKALAELKVFRYHDAIASCLDVDAQKSRSAPAETAAEEVDATSAAASVRVAIEESDEEEEEQELQQSLERLSKKDTCRGRDGWVGRWVV
eukprot:Skav234283  [mRNA]  locus=scaffold2271:15408:22113:+ [translate_table: standard]